MLSEFADDREHIIGQGASAAALSTIELRLGHGTTRIGVALVKNIVVVTLKPVVSGVNRALKRWTCLLFHVFVDAMAKFTSPNYPNAPVVEVALSVQFQPLAGFAAAHAGEFWQLIKSDFPIAQEQSPLGHINEFFGAVRPSPNVLDLEFSIGFLGARSIFVTEAGDFLVQVQKNRFAVNWRKTPASPNYPRYEVIKEKFERYFDLFRGFVSSSGIGSVVIDLFEVHYVNQWPLQDGKPYGEVIGDWLKLLTNDVTTLSMEQASISTQYLIKGKSDQPVGRLYLNVGPAVNSIGQFGVSLDFICRTLPFERGKASEFAPLDLAREKIVTTFQQITSDSAHKFWHGKI